MPCTWPWALTLEFVHDVSSGCYACPMSWAHSYHSNQSWPILNQTDRALKHIIPTAGVPVEQWQLLRIECTRVTRLLYSFPFEREEIEEEYKYSLWNTPNPWCTAFWCPPKRISHQISCTLKHAKSIVTEFFVSHWINIHTNNLNWITTTVDIRLTALRLTESSS